MQVIVFNPTPAAPFQFQATLDNAVYNVVIPWNLYQRWYITITDQTGKHITTLPLIGSPLNFDISLTGGYFKSTLVFRQATQTFEISP